MSAGAWDEGGGSDEVPNMFTIIVVYCFTILLISKNLIFQKEFAKNHWGKVPNFWDLGKSLMKFNSTHVVAICDGEVLTTWRGNFSEYKD